MIVIFGYSYAIVYLYVYRFFKKKIPRGVSRSSIGEYS